MFVRQDGRVPLLSVRLLVAGIVGSVAVGLAPSAPLGWQPWQHVAGVFDLAGPRSDGRLVVAAGGRLFLMSPDGTIAPFADGPGGYQAPSGPEAYLDVSPGLHVSGAACDFARDDIFIIRPSAPLGITRVDALGHATNFTNISGVDTLNGIVFDTVGRFDHRLLVTGPHNQHSTVLAIDCNAGIVPITTQAPPAEGGLAIAPPGFGAHGGELIAPDELTGAVWTIAASGHSELLVASGIAHGGDIGVESAGFVPAGLIARGGTAYVADRATANNAHPGTDSVLRISATDLAAAGVRDSDLLIAAEGGGVTIRIRCTSTCAAATVVPTETTAHIEGHLVILANHPSPTPSALAPVADLGSQRAQTLFRAAIGIVATAVVIVLVVLGVRRVRQR
jgi:hypothetical protein